jgi:hypothetical protein
MKRILKLIPKMQDDELIALSREVDREIQHRFVELNSASATVHVGDYKRPSERVQEAPRPDYGKRRAA